ncbi:hypothetical protein N7490_002594 [Penicillium lividum]|nr:hypothetical protein N7490_002594 [Penicillium lividum]
MRTSSLPLGAGSLFLLSLASSAIASDYELVETWQGEDFFDYFHFYTGEDPTKGWVTYVDQASAESAGLVKITDKGSVYIGVDHTTTLSPSDKGRDSVRVGTTKYYEQSLVIADLAHMPGSVCGSWPAFWTVGQKWPQDGEIDIIEGVNLQDHNEIVMHTAGTCALTDQGMSGYVNATGCGEALGPVGCVVEGQQGSYGTSFNNQGGGVYALEWTEEFLKIWFFPRDAIPASITSGDPDTSEFGIPMALVQEGCDVANSFKAQSFVFDVTFCGDWAGGVFGDSGCPMTSSDSFQSCTDYVAQNPAKFKETYWEINSVKVYQTEVKATDPAPSHVSASHEVSLPVTHTHATKTATETHVNRPSDTSASVANRLMGESTNSSDNGSDAEDVILTVGYVHPISSATSTFSKPTFKASMEQAPVATHAKPVTTRYVTEFVTGTTTICTESESSSSHHVVKSAVSSAHGSQAAHASVIIHPASSVALSAHSSNLPHASETTHTAPTYASDAPHVSETTHAAPAYASDAPHASETTHTAPAYASDIPHVSETTHTAPTYASDVPRVSETTHAAPTYASDAPHVSETTHTAPTYASDAPHASETTHTAPAYASDIPHVSETTHTAPTYASDVPHASETTHTAPAYASDIPHVSETTHTAPTYASDVPRVSETTHAEPSVGPFDHASTASHASEITYAIPAEATHIPHSSDITHDAATVVPSAHVSQFTPAASSFDIEPPIEWGTSNEGAAGQKTTSNGQFSPYQASKGADAALLNPTSPWAPVMTTPTAHHQRPTAGLGEGSTPATPLASPQTSKPVIPKPSGSSLSPDHTLHPVPGASPSGASPFFTGAADKLSVKYSLIAAAIGFAFFA